MATTVSRFNITLPNSLAKDLKEIIPSRERSKIIAEALREKIAMVKRVKGLKKMKGTWAKFGGKTFKSDKELTAWRKSLWSTVDKRLQSVTRG